MPQQTSNSNSKRKKKKSNSRTPAHQNAFAYRHNPKSKLTAKILASPNEGVCKRCYEKIEWRKQYRKYKPLTQPATCNLCKRRNIMAAYHTICEECALSDLAWKKMILSRTMGNDNNGDNYVNASSGAISSSASTNLDANNDTVGAETESATAVANESDTLIAMQQSTKQKRVCAMCTKSPALINTNKSHDTENEIEEQISLMEQKLNRPLKLRETKAIERKVIRKHEKEKERLKEERRRAREEAGGKGVDAEGQRGDDDNNSEVSDDNVVYDEDKESIGEVNQDEIDNNDSGNDDNDDDDGDDDPFLKAIGGQDKLLTGEAYRQMILERERLANVKISSL